MSTKKPRSPAPREHPYIRRQRVILSVIGLLVIAAFLLSLVR
ncbi:MAG TPA: hypothetical protein VLD63_07290 [Anaerolineales bacterium]|nr:hypothetical protein [Anaerolineales bacterium]